MAYENKDVRIERKVVHTASLPTTLPGRKMAMVAKKVNRKTHNEEAADKAYWLSRPVAERLDAVTRLRLQFIKKGERMNRSYGIKRKRR